MKSSPSQPTTYDLLSTKRVAIVCDWLTGIGGAERIVLQLHQMFPDAPIYTSQYDPNKIDWFADADVRTGWLQKLPVSLKKFLPVLRAWYFSHLDLSDYDLIISNNFGAESKAVKFGKNTRHICICNAPTHYYWSRYDDYIRSPGFGKLDFLARFGLKMLVSPMRRWDYRAAGKPTQMVAISSHIQQQIKKYYDRDSVVIHPPVDVDRFQTLSTLDLRKTSQFPDSSRGDEQMILSDGEVALATSRAEKLLDRSSGGFGDAGILGKSSTTYDLQSTKRSDFVITGRQTPYKRIDLAVAACTKLDLPLTVIGNGPEHTKLVKMAGKTINFVTTASDDEVTNYLATAEAFIFPGLDDFGIAPVEALAAGTPVIAFKAGGALDYITEGKTGQFFSRQTPESLVDCLQKFNPANYSADYIKNAAKRFSKGAFIENMKKEIDLVLQ